MTDGGQWPQAFNSSNVPARVGGGGSHSTPLQSRPGTAAAGGRASRASSDAQAASTATVSQQVPTAPALQATPPVHLVFFVFFFTSARMLPPGRVTDYVNLGMDSSTMQSLSPDCTPPLEAVLGLRLWRQPHTCRSGCSPRLRRLLCIPNLSRHALSQVTWLPRSCGNTGCMVVLSAHAAVSYVLGSPCQAAVQIIWPWSWCPAQQCMPERADTAVINLIGGPSRAPSDS